MGAAESQGIYSQIDLNHPVLRNCQTLTKDTLTFLKVSMTCQLPQYEQWKQEMNDSNLHESDNDYLLMPLRHKFEEGGVCSTAGELTMEYDYYPKLLSVEIKDRMKDKLRFTEAELWYLLYVLVSARQAMVLQGMEVGDIQPKNVFLNANQQAKVACQLSWPGFISSFKKAVLQEGFEYLSPEDIVRLKLGAMDNKSNSQSQTFAIGLTLLSASCLQPMNDLYRVKERDIDQELFGARLSVFTQDRNYSDIYRAVVCNLLELDPIKRMNQQQLGQLLFKHRQNLETKKPLMFDNVNKKLQQSINTLLKIAPQLLSGSVARGSRTNSKGKEGQPPNQSINYQDLNQQPFRQSGTRSVDKNKPPVINFTGSGVRIPVSPSQQRKIVFNNPPTGNIPPSLPLYMPPRPMNNVQPPRNSEMYQTGSRAQPPPQKIYRPFENITPGSPKMAQLQRLAEESKVQHIVTFEKGPEEGEEKSTVTQLLMETRKGGFLVEMSQIKRKDPKKSNEETSILKDEHNSSLVVEKAETNSVKLQENKMEVKPENNLKKIESHEEVINIESTEAKKTILQTRSNEQTNVQKHTEQLHLENKPDEKTEQPLLDAKTQQLHQDDKADDKKKEESGIKQAQKQNKAESSKEINTVSCEYKPATVTNSNSNSQSRASNDSKSSQSKFTPSVKIWGMQKGKLTIQEVGSSSPYVPKPSSNSQEDIPKAQSVPEVKIQENKEAIKAGQQISQAKQQSDVKVEEVKAEHLDTSNNQNQHQTSPEIQTNKVEQIVSSNEEQIQQKQKYEPHKQILIEQPSKPLSEVIQTPDSPKKEKEEQESKIVHKPQQSQQECSRKDNNSQRSSVARSRQRSGSFVRESATDKKQFVFSEIATEGNFDECWSELIRLVKEPHSYSRKIKPEKVDPLQNQYGQFIRVGPARMKVNLNKEQGKIWLQGLPSSLCQGDIFCGVVKKEDKLNYIWINSSLTYKGVHFPPLEVIEEGLQVAENNIHRKHPE